MIRAPKAHPVTLVALVALVGCAAPRHWQELDVGDRDFEQVWTTFAEISRKTGHPAGSETDRGLREFVSRWRERPLPFGKSRRTRVHGKFERDETTRAWLVSYRVEAQRVKDFARAMEPSPDDWVAAGQDDQLEQLIGAQMQTQLGMIRLQGQ